MIKPQSGRPCTSVPAPYTHGTLEELLRGIYEGCGMLKIVVLKEDADLVERGECRQVLQAR